MCTPRARASGFTLVELVMFIVIVSIAVAGVLAVMNITTRHSADPMIQKQALAVAEAMLEEIELQDFTKPAGGFAGPYNQANRKFFDSVGDYSGFSTVGIYTIDGVAPIAALAGYNISVSVADSALGPGGSQVAAGEAKLITVTVTDPRHEVTKLSGYRTRYGQ